MTLRLTSSMYHRFHAPHDCRVEQVTYISGDTWNTNPIAIRRVERLFCKNERAVLRTRLAATSQLVTLVPVASILVASIRLHFLDVLLHLRYSGPNVIACDARFRKGEEMGWFELGSTIIVFAPAGFGCATTYAKAPSSGWEQPLLRTPLNDAQLLRRLRSQHRDLRRRLQRHQVGAEHVVARVQRAGARCSPAPCPARQRTARRQAAIRSSSMAPLTPSSTRSTGPGAGTDATGSPDAIASSSTLPKVSVRDGNTKQSALAKCAARSSPKR